MAYLRRISTRRLLALCAAALAAAASVTAIALAATSGGPVPRAKPLARAIHDALAAPAVPGITARIAFTNHLVDTSLVQGQADPLLSGATGRLWAAGDRLRIELQSDGGAGDSQLLLDGRALSFYDAGAGTVYRATLPPDRHARNHAGAVPSLARIQRALTRLMRHASVSGAQPTDVGGRPAYSVRITPRHDRGMVGAAELAWDAVHGEPLRAAVYARGSSDPVLSLTASDVSIGPVAASVFDVPPPTGAKVVDLSPPRGARSGRERKLHVSFPLSAPPTLAGLKRTGMHAAGHGAAITYGRGLGAIVVLEQPAAAARPQRPRQQGGGLALPSVRLGAVHGQELATALGTLIEFERGGVAFTVAGSVPPSVAEAAARGL